MPVLGAARAVIFDLDGTLVDSLGDIAGHLNAALADCGLPEATPDQIRGWVGTGAAQLVAQAVPDPGRAPDVLARFRARYRAAPYANTHVFPGLDGALDRLVAAGRTLAVLSNKPHDLVVEITRVRLARWPFASIAGERPGVPRKPDPGALAAVIGELGIPADRCVLVGDSEIDLATARAAGIPGVAVTWGLRDPDELASSDPAYVVDTPTQLVELFV